MQNKTHDYCRLLFWPEAESSFKKAQTTDQQVEILSKYCELVEACETERHCNGCGLCTRKPFIEKDVIDTFERFCPAILNREPNKNSDNYRELLPKELWEQYPSYMRAFLLDSGRLRVHELGNPQVQIDTIHHLKSKGQWSDLPLIVKLGVFFGLQTKEDFIDAEQKARKTLHDASLKGMKEEDDKYKFILHKYKKEKEAHDKALRELYHAKSEDEFFEKFLVIKLRSQKNE